MRWEQEKAEAGEVTCIGSVGKSQWDRVVWRGSYRSYLAAAPNPTPGFVNMLRLSVRVKALKKRLCVLLPQPDIEYI